MVEQYSQTSDPPRASIRTPHCPKCGERMGLARMARGRSGFAISTLKCDGCHYIHTAVAEADPMKSEALLWLSSHGLRAPT